MHFHSGTRYVFTLFSAKYFFKFNVLTYICFLTKLIGCTILTHTHTQDEGRRRRRSRRKRKKKKTESSGSTGESRPRKKRKVRSTNKFSRLFDRINLYKYMKQEDVHVTKKKKASGKGKTKAFESSSSSGESRPSKTRNLDQSSPDEKRKKLNHRQREYSKLKKNRLAKLQNGVNERDPSTETEVQKLERMLLQLLIQKEKKKKEKMRIASLSYYYQIRNETKQEKRARMTRARETRAREKKKEEDKKKKEAKERQKFVDDMKTRKKDEEKREKKRAANLIDELKIKKRHKTDATPTTTFANTVTEVLAKHLRRAPGSLFDPNVPFIPQHVDSLLQFYESTTTIDETHVHIPLLLEVVERRARRCAYFGAANEYANELRSQLNKIKEAYIIAYRVHRPTIERTSSGRLASHPAYKECLVYHYFDALNCSGRTRIDADELLRRRVYSQGGQEAFDNLGYVNDKFALTRGYSKDEAHELVEMIQDKSTREEKIFAERKQKITVMDKDLNIEEIKYALEVVEVATQDCCGGAYKIISAGRCGITGGMNVMKLTHRVFVDKDSNLYRVTETLNGVAICTQCPVVRRKSDGYTRVQLQLKCGETKYFQVSRLVFAAYYPKVLPYQTIEHLDGNESNDRM
jgi:hypothetical protein